MNIVLPDGEVRVPSGMTDHAAFLKWLRSDAAPDDLPVGWVMDDVWVEIMAERAFAHNKIKTLLARVLDALVDENQLGVYFGDGMAYTNEAEEFTSVPDGMFASRGTIDAGRVSLTGGRKGQQDTELIGVPDLMIEVVSDRSYDKDTAWLMAKYWAAGIPEYWVIDARTEPLRFTLYRHRPDGYSPARKADGWARSPVLGRAFRFVPTGQKIMNRTTYNLEVR